MIIPEKITKRILNKIISTIDKNPYCKEVLEIKLLEDNKRYDIIFIDKKYNMTITQKEKEFTKGNKPMVLCKLALKERAIEKWGDEFDYTDTIFQSVGKKIKFKHKATGLEIEQGLQLHLAGSRPYILNDYFNRKRAIDIFKNEDGSPVFDYSKTDFSSTQNIIKFKHIESGIYLKQDYYKHISGAWPLSRRLIHWRFEKEANEKYNYKYKYEPYIDTDLVWVKYGKHRLLKNKYKHLLGYDKDIFTNKFRSAPEIEIYEYIKTLSKYDEIHINAKPAWMNYRELDIFIPELNVAIEYNGVIYHHSSENCNDFLLRHKKHKDYHFNKWKWCKENNVTLLSIYEFHWADPIKREIIKSKIRSLLKLNEKIYARKLSIDKIDNKDAKEFYLNNHIEGYGLFQKNAKSFALKDGNSIYMVFTIHEEYNQSKKSFELKLHRICTLSGWTVVGGLSKCSKFIKENFGDFKYLITLSTGGSSISNNNLVRYISPRYFWVNPNSLVYYHRNYCQKHLLEKHFGEPLLENDTESTYMERLGFLKVYDNGLAEIMF